MEHYVGRQVKYGNGGAETNVKREAECKTERTYMETEKTMEIKRTGKNIF